jgi:2-keto-4-pentenoate hydratase/2-oxohepta-3-ene-1,7-dioic acid hydratase in catechol pathway
VHFEFYQNNELKQKSNSGEMLFSIDQIIAYVSRFVTLKTGDLIFTGTPAGVGPVAIGDHLSGNINGEKMFDFVVS